jgi:hypothetical protein
MMIFAICSPSACRARPIRVAVDLVLRLFFSVWF